MVIMKRHYIQYIFIFLIGFATPCMMSGAAGLGGKLSKGVANFMQELTASAGHSAGAATAHILRDKQGNKAVAPARSAQKTLQTTASSKKFGKVSAAFSGRSSTTTQSNSQLHEGAFARKVPVKTKKPVVLFRSQVQSNSSSQSSAARREALPASARTKKPSIWDNYFTAPSAAQSAQPVAAQTEPTPAVHSATANLHTPPAPALKKVKKQKKETAQTTAHTQSLPRSPSVAQAPTPRAPSAASVVRGLQKKVAHTQSAQASETTTSAVNASASIASQAAQQPAHAIVVMPAAAAFKSKSPNVKQAFKISEQFAQMLADIFKRAQPIQPEGAMIEAPVVAPLNQLGVLAKSIAQHKLKPCIVGEDFIRQLMQSNQVNGSILTDAHNKVLGVIGKKTAHGYTACLFDESIVKAMVRKIGPAKVYRHHMDGKAAVKQIGYNQQPESDIFVFLAKDQKLRSNIQEIFNILSGTFVDPQGAPHLPSIAIVCSGNVVPILKDLMPAQKAIKAPRKAPVNVKADIPQPKPVIEPDVQHAQDTALPDAQQECAHDTFTRTNGMQQKPAQPKPTAQHQKTARTSARNITQQQYAAAYNAGMAMPKMMSEGARASVNEKPGVPSSSAAPKEPVRAQEDPVKNKRDIDVEQPKPHHDEGHKQNVKARPRSGKRNVHRPTSQVPPINGEDVFDFHLFDEGPDLPLRMHQEPAEPSGSKKDPVFQETYPEIERNRPAQTQQEPAAKDKPAQQNQPDAQPVTVDAADDNDTNSSSCYNYKPDGSYHPGYDPVNNETPKDTPMPAQPAEQSRVPHAAKKDTPATAVPHQGMPAGAPITGGTATIQGNSMNLPDTKVSKFDAYGMPLIESKAKVKKVDNQSAPISKTHNNNGMMPTFTTQEAAATTMPVSAPAAPTTVGILSIIGMILTIIASAILRVLFAPFRFF
jgi:hypothetical protein